jgi:recombinase
MTTPTTKRAVIYLRVSTRDQAKRGGETEGFSIPAQREACHRKAKSLGAEVIEEFIDAGESAKSAQRPELQRMLTYVKHNTIQLVIVHKVDRLARNRMDDVQINFEIQQAGAQLVSCSENIDETPSGMLLHGIMSSIAEFYSQNLATEAKKGMTQKAKSGGTPGRAPFGYTNTTQRTAEGREVRTVVTDPDRAHWVPWMYERYATGEWTIGMLRDELKAHGVTTLARPKQPARPLTSSMVHSILSNPYYTGLVVFGGATYQGRHQPLVSTELWSKVEAIRNGRSHAKEKPAIRTHYLKGSLFCGQCGSPLSYEISRNRLGNYYQYFYCLGRQARKNGCTFVAIQAHHAEQLIEDHWATITLPDETLTTVRELVIAHLDAILKERDHQAHQAETILADATTRSERLMQAYYAGAIDVELLRKEQERIRTNKTTAERQLRHLQTSRDKLHTALDQCLSVLHNGQQQYLAATDNSRRDLNQAVFDKIYLDDDEITNSQHKAVYHYLLDSNLPAVLEGEAKRQQDTVTPGNTKNLRPMAGGSNVTLLVALTDTLSKQWQPLLELVASLPPDFTTRDQVSAVSRLPHRVKFTSLSVAQRAEVARLYAIGVAVPDICARFNITKNTVIRLRKQAGVPQRERGLNEPQGDEAEVMYASGKSLLTIAKHFSTGVGAVRGCLLRRGVRMRRRNGG